MIRKLTHIDCKISMNIKGRKIVVFDIVGACMTYVC